MNDNKQNADLIKIALTSQILKESYDPLKDTLPIAHCLGCYNPSHAPLVLVIHGGNGNGLWKPATDEQVKNLDGKMKELSCPGCVEEAILNVIYAAEGNPQ